MKEYFNFNGVAKRQEFWAVHIVSILVLVIAMAMLEGAEILGALVALVALVATLWAIIAVTVKRLRDVGLNTWWILAILVPYVGTVATIVFGCLGTAKQDD
tara:strand:+ start:1532 stop:1834 length:303 start_codon:yes stop_codon:yes gene_type:complete